MQEDLIDAKHDVKIYQHMLDLNTGPLSLIAC